ILCGLIFASLLFFFINFLHSSHVLTGLVLNMIFYGLSAVIGDIGLDIAAERRIPRTIISPLLLRWYHITLIAVITSVIIWFLLYRTKLGTAIRACGFNPRAADYLGVKIWKTRYIALIIGYTLIALSGYTYTLFYKKSWSTYIGVGYGFLALALAMSSLWHPLIVLVPVAIFGYLLRSLYVFQLEYGIPQHILSMIPYIVAIAFVTIITA
ncbi:MAG: ABC transporter permease, partial [Ignisphaera sp.]